MFKTSIFEEKCFPPGDRCEHYLQIFVFNIEETPIYYFHKVSKIIFN
jgi:hypothetical protein